MTLWFAYGAPLSVILFGIVGYFVLRAQSKALDRKYGTGPQQ